MLAAVLAALVALDGGRAAAAAFERIGPGGIAIRSLAPGLSLVTHVSEPEPLVRQQLSIVYSLRAERPPAAVDVLPQQYNRLWTEVVPLPAEGTALRERGGRAAYESLLRQVIAYPLDPGVLELPPLVLRIRTGLARLNARQWDLEVASLPLRLNVRPLPASGDAPVGTLDGRLSRSGPNEALLEIEGTAHPAFFDPDRYARTSGGWALPARLVEATEHVETRERDGHRTLRTTYRRSWSIRVVAEAAGRVALEPIVILVTEPGTGAQREVRIAGVELEAPGGAQGPAHPGPRLSRRLGAVLAAFVGVLLVAAAWRMRRIARRRPFPLDPARSDATVGRPEPPARDRSRPTVGLERDGPGRRPPGV